jgi:Putative MetA-pathway of phenol degradation
MKQLNINLYKVVLLIVSLTSSFAAELRPLNTDRPDTTESPYSVDKGHFQFETELAAWSRDKIGNAIRLGEINAKYGLTNSSDLQLVIPFYNKEKNGGEGFGEMKIRFKKNLWGNDEGDTALALMPFIKIPTGNGMLSNDKVEGGLIMPLGFKLSGSWNCATMVEVDFNANKTGDNYHFTLVNSITASHPITEKSATFFELVNIASMEKDVDSEAYFNTGITFAASEILQWDGGVRLGLTDSAADITPFLGLSAKF